MNEPRNVRHSVTFTDAVRVWAKVGLNSFGGPAGQIAVMHRELVDGRRWVSERRFLHALNYCMVLPGPEAQQLATYLGWLMHGVRGGFVAGGLFVLPGFLVMLALSALYAVYGKVGWVAGLLFGVQAAVVAVVAEAVIRIGRRTLRSTALRALAAASFVAIFAFAVPFPVIVVAAALGGWSVGRARPGWFPGGGNRGPHDTDEAPALLPDDERVPAAAARRALVTAGACVVLWLAPVLTLVAALGTSNLFSQQGILFSKSAVVTFGGAYAVLGYIAQQAVGHYGWVGPTDMITGLGLAETTPGPLIMVVEFVAFVAAYRNPGDLSPLLAGTLAATLTVWVTFLPCFAFIFGGAPYVERLRDNASLTHALTAIGAAVAGVVLNLAVWFALHTTFAAVDDVRYGPLQLSIPDWSSLRTSSLTISVVAILLVFRAHQSTLRVLAGCALLGVVSALAGLG